MKNLYDKKQEKNLKNDPLSLRVYTSRLLGQNKNLVLHGGGNTSVKIEDYLYVKGSGWDLESIEKEGFPAVKLETLQNMVKKDDISDTQMVKEQKDAMIDKNAPNPSVEAILHAIIPYKYVDHTHADAVVTITNTPKGKEYISNLYKNDVLIVDYIMPGFKLAKKVFNLTKDINWNGLKGIILLNHGVFTFSNNGQTSYTNMIDIVTKAEEFLQNIDINIPKSKNEIDSKTIKTLQEKVSKIKNDKVIASLMDNDIARYISKLENIESIIHNGPLTPEHVIRTKPFPAIIEDDIDKGLSKFVNEYTNYFQKFATNQTMLDTAPRWIILKNRGVLVFTDTEKNANIIKDILYHTFNSIIKAQKLGGWSSINRSDIFDMEYWELEQAKIRRK